MKMKKLSLLIPILAAVALFAQPVLAEDVRQPEKTAQAAQGGTAGAGEKMNDHESMMQESMKKMHAQMAAIHQVKDTKKRLKLLQEHRKSMRDSIKMMRETMGGMAMECPMMGGGHMMGGNPAGQASGNANAAPAAQANPGQASAADKTSAAPDGKKLWTCPMHPDVVRDQPGLCPICGMDLVEKGQPGASQAGHNHAMGGCMMGGDMKCPMMGGSMKCPMMGGDMKCPMMGGSMKCSMMGGSMKCPMMGMMDKHMDMMLMLMEQMIEHDEAAMAVRK
jgi:rubrerythrin